MMRVMLGRRGSAVAGVLILAVGLGLFLAACGQQSRSLVPGAGGVMVMEDFESGALSGWRAVGNGAGGWFVYGKGKKGSGGARISADAALELPDAPQGRFAAATDMGGPGTLVLYRDVKLDGRFRLTLTVFHAGSEVVGFSSLGTLAYDDPEANQQFRIDLVAPSAPIDSVAPGDVLVNVFRTTPAATANRAPAAVTVDVSRWAGKTVRLRLVVTDNRGPLRAGVDNIRFEPIGSEPKARIELPVTKEPVRAR